MVAQPIPADPRVYVLACRHAARVVKHRQSIRDAEAAGDWQSWLSLVFPGYVSRGFAGYHAEFWDWVWSISASERREPFVAVWPRGAGKSTSTELACAVFAARRTRTYALYVSETQDQADKHVANVASLLESSTYGDAYRQAGSRRLTKYGHSKGWRVNRLRTASGFVLDGIGLDTAARGTLVDSHRPDLLIFDDIDGKQDSPAATEKKIETLTHTLIPAGADHATTLAVQNLVIPDGVFARLADGRADFLADRRVSGPHPAVAKFETKQIDGRTTIVGGEPTWPAGMDLAACQAMIDSMGITAFRAEEQHEVDAPPGGMFDHLDFPAMHVAWDDLPPLTRKAVWVDPAVTNTDQSDCMGIQADGKGTDGRLYRLWSWEDRTSPEDALRRAILKAVEIGAGTVGVETDQGGDVWRSAFRAVVKDLIDAGMIAEGEAPTFREEKAGRTQQDKAHRASSHMLVSYERDRVRHVLGTHTVLDRALKRFPRSKPFDLVDAAVWSHDDLMRGVDGSLAV
jgi:hypothetical protein